MVLIKSSAVRLSLLTIKFSIIGNNGFDLWIVISLAFSVTEPLFIELIFLPFSKSIC